MIRSFSLFLFCMLAGMGLAQKKEKVRVAVVDMDSVMAHMPEMMNALLQLDTATARFQKEMEVMLKDLANALYPDPSKKKTDVQFKREVDSLQKRLTNFQKYSRDEVEKRRRSLYTDIHKNSLRVCVKFAKKNGFKVLLDKKDMDRPVIYNELASVEITDRIVDQLKNASEKK
jgi:Skp family chaperone for outer membrane proteins